MKHFSHRAGMGGRRGRKSLARARRSQVKYLPGDRLAERQLEQYLVHAHIGVAHLDTTLRVRWANQAFVRLLNRTEQDLPGADFLDLFPDDTLLGIFQEVLQTGRPQTV